ncbi:MurR/RpiR family transcriptional regulator [Serratia sp. T13T92]|jgi:DNA-binding MurR/RpiR family transcriptional regulator|uniref:MurR/RpiR family transcriptional regulator n=1 Tax=Serratia TaxID=613 RepID=UPI0015761BC2|nr:MurR/RpiR family transcriptional regulator [Serratia fonticola]MDK2374174.1 MurR/RpiR family transcriptional regulator [Serratia fonticola]NTY89844.1 MurR/RpiR family transcriptional regulator [Serratia fonticola]NTZ15640.1 MurR/RpiR family transcriptional regulator [Serratia fonticola]CAI0855070.1 MurPQ operon repressor [Serratia fonticola]CAI0933785.1 MurPQ operon repressor [Serratia fonticola]
MFDLKLREVSNGLSAKERGVAEYIIANKQSLKNMSIQTLAKANNVSTTTILRLCHKLGYQGFSDLKIDLITASGSSKQDNVLQEDINLDDSIETVNGKIHLIEKSSIDETHAMMNSEQLAKANELIRNSNKVVIYGAGSSGLVGKELEYQLIKIKKDVSCHLDYSIQFSIVNTLDKHDLLIIISHSGENQDGVKLLTLAQQLGVPSIAITKMGQSRISGLADVLLHTISTESVSRLIPIRSKISQLSVINMLVTNLFIQQYDERLLKQTQTRAERFYNQNNKP